MIEITICPSCGSKRIKKKRCNWESQLQDQPYTVPDLEFYECPDCGEKLYDREAMRKIEVYSPAFRQKRPQKKIIPSS